MEFGPYWYQIGNKTCYIPKISPILCRKRISSLAGLKMSSLTSKCPFNIPKYNAKGGPRGTKF